MEVRFGVGLFLLSFLPLVLASSQQNNKTSDSLTNNYQLSRKPCQVKGQEGTCMFVWECVKTEGTPLGMCMERFMFGSCCAHDLDNNVVPKPSVPSSIGSVGVGHATTIQNTGGAITPGTASLLTTLITRTPPPLPTTASWSANNTDNVTTSTVSLTIGSSVNASVDFISSNELELTASRTNNSVTSSTPSYTSTTPIDGTSSAPISSTQTPSSVSSTKPTGSQPTSGPNKIRPKPYRRTTTRKPAVPTVASGISNTPVATNATAAEPLNQALMPSLAPLVAPAINLLIPNTHAIHNPIIASPSVTDSSLTPTTQLSSTLLQLSDVLVAITVPSPYLSAVPITESNSAILMAPIDLPDPPASLNELNYTAEIPDAIPTASDKPYYDPSFHAHFTTGSLSTTDEADFTESETLVYESTSEGTTMVTPTTTFAPTSFATNEFTVTTTEPVAVTTVTSVDTAQSISTPPSSTVKPVLHVTPPSIKNTTSTEITKRPIMAVTSLPSSHPSTECGIAPLLARQEGGRIVGGTASKFGSWPWQVSVRRTSFFGFSSTHRCGGALLNELWVITAGHCVEDLLVSQIRLRMGEFDFSSVQEPFPFIERGVNKKIVHPKYNFFTYEYDLALVRLEEPVTFQPNIVPICLPATDETLIGQNGTVTGWGRLSEGGTLPSMLQQVTVPIVSNDKCKDMFLKAGRHEYIPDIFMCAGFEEGGRDSCQGDSGGPLQIRGKDGKYFLAGIISWGIGCAEANLPGVCTRISKFTSWILENVT